MIRKIYWKWLGLGALLLSAPIALITASESRLIYFPRPYPAGHAQSWAAETPGKLIDFTTSQGRQRAFLQGNLNNPRNLWLVCGGNATLALEWSEWLATHAPSQDAWLLVDFPGYGDSQGKPSPERMRETFQQAVPAVFSQLGWSLDGSHIGLRFFGHSLGGAACLIAASEFDIRRGVLLAPFTSTMEMSRALTGLPLGFLVRHRYDNIARLNELTAKGPGMVVILHGAADEIIPVAMSRKLAALHPNLVKFKEIENATHNTLQFDHAPTVARALHEVGATPDR